MLTIVIKIDNITNNGREGCNDGFIRGEGGSIDGEECSRIRESGYGGFLGGEDGDVHGRKKIRCIMLV